MTVLEKLGDDKAPDLPYYKDVDKLDTRQIKRLAIGAERAHINWANLSPTNILSVRIDLPEDCDPAEVQTRVRLFNVVQLLPGRRFLIGALSFTKTIACWDLQERRLVFTHNITPGHLFDQIHGLSAHICDEGRFIVISAVKNLYSNQKY